MKYSNKPKKTENLILLCLVCTVLLSTALCSAEIQNLPTGKVNQNMQLTQTVTNSTYCNISKITYPNNSILNLNSAMTKSNNDYNYTFNPSDLGEYSYITCCNPDGTCTCASN